LETVSSNGFATRQGPAEILMAALTRLQKIEAMLADQPADPELHYMLAMEHASLGDDAGAVRCFQKLIDVAPNYPPAYHMAGRTLQRQGRIDEARALLQKGIPIAMAQNNTHAAGEMQELLDMLE
jgi:tetratricopeptide (TPR) repeat protein